ncbi:MAG: hypothetical protein IT522_07355 [Burkholderiales bacterium]|nr:hypothetical protein [Burkholderiales bacterium]
MNDVVKTSRPIDGEVEHVLVAARDALTDEMVGRLSATAADAMDMVDQVQRSGLAKAIPQLAQLVNDGDLERLANLARVYAAGQDALTDEMVGRLTDAVGGGLAFIDQAQRAGLERAIPVLVELVDNGDLQRLVKLARLYGSAEDALTEEMIGRLAETFGNGVSLLDRVSRGGGERIVAMLERLETSGSLEKMAGTLPRLLERLDQVQAMLECVDAAAAESAKTPRSTGGIGSLWRTMKDGETQDTLRFLMLLGKQLRTTAPRTNVAG